MGQQATDLSPGAKKNEAGQQPLIKIEAPVSRGRAKFCAGTTWLRCCQPCLDSPCCQKCTHSAGRTLELPSFGVSLLRTEGEECQGPRKELCVMELACRGLGCTVSTSPPPPVRPWEGRHGRLGSRSTPGQDAGAWLLADISMSGVCSSPVQPQALCQHNSPLGALQPT